MDEKQAKRARRHWFPGSRSALLLTSLFLLLAIYPFFERRTVDPLFGHGDRLLAAILVHAIFTLILFGGAWLVHDRPKVFRTACVLGVPWLVFGWVDQAYDLPIWLDAVGDAFFAAFVLFVAVSQVGFVLRARRVTLDVLLRAVSVYLLTGVAWTAMYKTVALLVPGAFHADPGVLHGANGQPSWGDLVYFSFCTLSTLGPGDITAAASYARSLVVLECVIGPLYLAVLLARLVAIYGQERKDPGTSRK
jgi:hypothetical protein